MPSVASMRMSNQLKTQNYHGCNEEYIGGVGKTRLHSVKINISSQATRQDGWNIYILNNVSRKIIPVSPRCNVFLCRSFLLPGKGNGTPVVNSALKIMTRSYDALRGSPLLFRLVPAVGIIAFATWGLGPLTRFFRATFLHSNDGSWKKSNTHYVISTYLQPLVLWTGAILICRALDPIVLLSESTQAVKQRVLSFVRSLSTVLAFAYLLSSLVQQVQKSFTETNQSSDARNMGFSFAGKALYTAVWVAALSLFMELLGFSTQKWLTAGGLGTVLLTLAGREIFTNFLSSVMIHATRPFVLNEWIQTKIDGYEVSGTVEHVGWWSPTIIRGDDREAVHIPNHKFTVNIVRNLSQKTHWRIKSYLAISHLDVNKINNIVADMRKVLSKNPQVEQQRLHRRVFLENINPENQALMILISCFVKTSHFEEYLCVKEAILLDLLRVVSHHRARLATPIRTVQKIYPEADVENVSFADIVFTTASSNRPMLIEPSYKIHNDDKTKTSTRSVQSNDEKDSKIEYVSQSDPKTDAKAGLSTPLDSKKDKVSVVSSTNPNSNSNSSRSSTVSGTQASGPGAVSGDEKNESTVDEQKVNKEPNSGHSTSVGEVNERTPSANPEAGTGKSVTSSANSMAEQDTEKPPGALQLEENIVLGVALDGSKRTLPIEEDLAPEKSIEFSANRSGSASPPPHGKEKRDGQVSVGPGD